MGFQKVNLIKICETGFITLLSLIETWDRRSHTGRCRTYSVGYAVLCAKYRCRSIQCCINSVVPNAKYRNLRCCIRKSWPTKNAVSYSVVQFRDQYNTQELTLLWSQYLGQHDMKDHRVSQSYYRDQCNKQNSSVFHSKYHKQQCMPEHAVWLAHYRKYLSRRRIAESFSISAYPYYIKKRQKRMGD